MIKTIDAIAPDSTPKVNLGMQLAYRGSAPPTATYFGMRTSRGRPVMRAGKLVVATPQFKALTLYSPVSTNSQLPTAATSPSAIAYPTEP